jgi:hypothetical protein
MSKIRFRHDLYNGDQPLNAAFPKFSMACCKEASVVEHLQFINNNLQWNITFSRPVHE